MKKIYIDKAREGMILAETVKNRNEEVLLERGIVLNRISILRLCKRGVIFIYVEDDHGGQKEVEMTNLMPPIHGLNNEAYHKALEKFQYISTEIQKNKQISVVQITHSKEMILDIVTDVVSNRVILEEKNVDYLVNDLLEKDMLLQDVENIRCHDEYTFIHSVNVCTMSIIVGLAMNYRQRELLELGLAALLHDVGKINISTELINKPGKLNDLEREEMQRHSQYTYDFLKDRSDISSRVARAAYQHHEKFDGTGYPQGLIGKAIDEFARIIAIADVYDALVTDRSYRAGMLSYEAAEIIQALVRVHFDLDIVQAFLKYTIIYPVGSWIVLNTGEKGLVCKTCATLPTRPIIVLTNESNGMRILPPRVLDLSKSLTSFIVKVCASKEEDKFEKEVL